MPHLVQLYIYDLSNGLARQLSMALLGKQVNAIYHTAVCVYGLEIYFSAGIQIAPQGQTPFGASLEIKELGQTEIPREVFDDYIAELRNVFTPESYDLFENNCNNFSDQLAMFLTGSGIPAHITSLPRDVLATPFGQMIAPMMQQTLQSRLGGVHQPSAPAATSAQASAFAQNGGNITDATAKDMRAVSAAVVADIGIPLDSRASAALRRGSGETSEAGEPSEAAALRSGDQARPAPAGMQQIAAANRALNANKKAAAEVSSSLGRASLTNESGLAARSRSGSLGLGSGQKTGSFASLSSRSRSGSGHLPNSIGTGRLLPDRAPPRADGNSGASTLLGTSPDSAAAAAPETLNPTAANGRSVTLPMRPGRSSATGRPPHDPHLDAKSRFDATVRQEFAAIMEEGDLTPNEAALEAIKRATRAGRARPAAVS